MSEAMFQIRNVKKYYPVKSKKGAVVKALDDVSFDIMQGEILGVVGESGCGKSTLLRCIMRLVDITDGSITFRGEDLTKIDGHRMKELRRQMQMVFQNPFSSFNPKHTIGHSLEEVGTLFGMSRTEIKERIDYLLSVIGLDEVALTRRPGELSGGQLQRLAIARALMPKPEFIMADEPVSALDVSIQAQILNLFRMLQQELGLTYLFIGHGLGAVNYVSDRIAVMYLGQIVELADAQTLFRHPCHPYAQALFAAAPQPDPSIRQDPGKLLVGEVGSCINPPSGCRFHPRCPFATEQCRTVAPALSERTPGHLVACHRAAEWEVPHG